MMLLHLLAVPCEVFSITPTAWSPLTPDFTSPDFFLLGHIGTLVYAAPIHNGEALHHLIVDVCQTRNYPATFERIQHAVMGRVEVCIEGEYFKYFVKCTLSGVTQKLNISEQMLMWTLPTSFSYNLYIILYLALVSL